MAVNFPTSLDSNDTLYAVTDAVTDVLDEHHNNLKDAIIAVQTKLGITASTPAASKLLKGTGAGTSEWSTVTQDDIGDGSTYKQYSSTEKTKLSGIATGATANAKAIGSEVDTGSDDTKFLTVKSVNDSHNVPLVAPGNSGNYMKSDGTDWTSSAFPAIPVKASSAELDTGTDDAKFATAAAIAGRAEKDGWTPARETWTYASASTITVPSGAGAKYSIGDKIKLTQTTVKYFYIIGVADTVLTVTGGTNFTVADAAITLPFYSKAASPLLFPQWFNYTPTYSADASMTYGTVTTNVAVFCLVGRLVHLHHRSTGTVGGTPAYWVGFTLPIASAISSADNNSGGAFIYDNAYLAGSYSNNSGTVIAVRPYNNGLWNAGGSKVLTVSMSYQI